MQNSVRYIFFLTIGCMQVAPAQDMRVATVNIWSGLTYEGSTTIESYESEAQHASRLNALVAGLRQEAPDVIALQEVNPATRRAREIADQLGYDVISQRVLSGIKIGCLGVPWNLNEGLAILARSELLLEFVDVIPLSLDFGSFGNLLSFHGGEQNAALIGAIRTPDGERILIVNTHLPAFPEDTPGTRSRLADICRSRGLGEAEISAWIEHLSADHSERSEMLDRLLEELDDRYPDTPLILLGDLNLSYTAPDIEHIRTRAGYSQATPDGGPLPTWDGAANPLTRYASRSDDADADPIEKLSRADDLGLRTIDHIFVRAPFRPGDIIRTERILDTPSDGMFASDHYGLMATVQLSGIRQASQPAVSSIEFLPIASYDTDVGFGYGIKAFFLDQLGSRESFDVILFNSTKGERWYRFVFSVPDFELRQGTMYPLALDVTLDYDKYLKNVFFGVGPGSRYDDREEYTREPFEAAVSVSRGLTRQTVVQAGGRYRWVRNANFSDTSAVPAAGAAHSTGTATAYSLVASVRHDTRNSYINPSRGVVLQAEAEWAPLIGNVSFVRAGGAFQYYTTLMYPKTVFAFRLQGQVLDDDQVPIQFLLPVGGNQTLRGFPQDRYLGKVLMVMNMELRFPLIWRFGAIAGVDAGKVWMAPADVDLVDWRANPTVGLRFYLDTFLVRADLGFGPETTGFYLNFGQIF